MCHVSRVTCHVSHVTCHLSVEGLLTTGPTLSSFLSNIKTKVQSKLLGGIQKYYMHRPDSKFTLVCVGYIEARTTTTSIPIASAGRDSKCLNHHNQRLCKNFLVWHKFVVPNLQCFVFNYFQSIGPLGRCFL